MSTFQWLCQDSNLDQKFRKLPFYPLNYRALIQAEYKGSKMNLIAVFFVMTAGHRHFRRGFV